MLTFTKKKSSYQKWYEQHKQELSEDRKNRYREDPEYRQRRIEASRNYRKGELRPPVPAGLLSVKETAERIGVGMSTLRGWRRMHLSNNGKLLPEPQVFKGRPFFTEKQIEALRSLKDFFKKYRMRSPKISQPILAQLSAFIFANWN